jgi:hypothetical protein
MINQPDGISLPSVNDTWEAIQIDPWAEGIPQHTYEPTIVKLRPETPDARMIPQLPTGVALMKPRRQKKKRRSGSMPDYMCTTARDKHLVNGTTSISN